jgi:S-adenosylmethionine:tRNA ribosyltransferase-isomerase
MQLTKVNRMLEAGARLRKHGGHWSEGSVAAAADSTLDFELPHELEAGEPPEARGLERDDVRLMVSYRSTDHIEHLRFHDLPRVLTAGDLVVINTSGTLNAALPATRADGTALVLHLSTHLPADLWIVEVREPGGTATRQFLQAEAGERLRLPAGGSATLLVPYLHGTTADSKVARGTRLWIARLQLPRELQQYLAAYGSPIRYGYVKQDWPSQYYQTVYATEMGSAEMPSAGRAFTPRLITQMVAHGIQFAPLLLHTGVASLEDHEAPYEEFYRVPLATSQAVNAAHAAGRRVIAVGTTVVRALETVTDSGRITHPGEGWTRLVITPERPIVAVDGMLSGLHEPRATHLAMLAALVGLPHLRRVYTAAIREGYLWHEFGDLHLMLP